MTQVLLVQIIIILTLVILDDGNFDEDDPKTIVYVRCIAMRNRVKQRKTFKNDISKELMPAAWHTT